MRANRKRSLIYLFFLLFMMACRTSACQDEVAVPLKGTDYLFNCKKFYEFKDGQEAEGYACSKVKCPPDSAEQTLYLYETTAQLKEMTLGDVQAKYCPVPAQTASNEAPTEPPTEAPTEPPTEAPADAPANATPLLKGTVSACDTGLGYINFPLAASSPDLAGKGLAVTINGTAVNCGVPAVNTSILACPLPPGAAFPIQVIVTLGGVEVNNFNYDGYFCTDTQSSSGDTGGDATVKEEPVVPLSCVPDPDDPSLCAP